MYHLIVHAHCIDMDLESQLLSSSYQLKLQTAKEEIERVLNLCDNNVFLLDRGDEKSVDVLFEKNDEVKLYGAYLGVCLKNAYDVLFQKGVDVKYSKKGCVGFY